METMMNTLRTSISLPWMAAIVAVPIGGYLGHARTILGITIKVEA
jgi:hypothetical protein